MDLFLSESEQREYVAWIHSPSVASPDPEETILAYKISRRIGCPGSKTLRALRGVPGVPEEIARKVEDFVANEPTLTFRMDAGVRRVTLVG